jgi:dATP/dGTP diphosphohydrolase
MSTAQFPDWFLKYTEGCSAEEQLDQWQWFIQHYPCNYEPGQLIGPSETIFFTKVQDESYFGDIPEASINEAADKHPIVGSDTKTTNPKDRLATHRLDLSLFPATARAYGAIGMTEGDCKYGGYNYRKFGVSASVYYSACNRHLDDWYNGEWADRTTGVPHLASALACIAILIDSHELNNMVDDRPPKVDYRGLLETAEGLSKKLHELFPNGPKRFREDNNEPS